jgi:hypothetical protein
MDTNQIFVLVHSPLAGALTWGVVANELHQANIEATLVTLPRPAAPPYYLQQAESIAKVIEELPAHSLPVLVGHGGAGALLPAVRQLVNRPLYGTILVDSDIPQDGQSRLDRFSDPAAADALRQSAENGRLAVWGAADGDDMIAAPLVREMFAAELRPTPLALYEEQIPVFAGWPDSPCGYIQFSPAYSAACQQAQANGWQTCILEGSHFHMLNRAGAVADALVEIVNAWEQ